MRPIKYLFQFFFISLLLIIFKIIGLKLSRILASKLFSIVGPFFRSEKIIEKNISFAFPNHDNQSKKEIANKMWKSYGKILAEYMFIKKFREIESEKFLNIKGQEILSEIKNSNEPVIFVSGHFDNFELMAMHIEKSGIDVAAIYRPLNNNFLNPLMENIRKKYICRKQIKKGVSGTKEILKHFKSGTSIALMIDQRVSQGIKSLFFNKNAFTTTIPAQFVKKFNCKIVPIYIERKNDEKFLLEIMEPITFKDDQNIENITLKLNQLLEQMILRNPHQWIWSHNRWK
ncbi:lysophospholipid acyltransferase family protein [Candidatus Pelagibacter communis]|uniref:lysophospholipid acyltransferase family protein n=1 Tax=Pelagibacter ubique TaxID=198252 RepID=UPI00094C507D|nr:lysophospholipid acyltransferase family protein [Candidatus Pelagibacter ubique]